jgi:hypothetical protein
VHAIVDDDAIRERRDVDALDRIDRDADRRHVLERREIVADAVELPADDAEVDLRAVVDVAVTMPEP